MSPHQWDTSRSTSFSPHINPTVQTRKQKLRDKAPCSRSHIWKGQGWDSSLRAPPRPRQLSGLCLFIHPTTPLAPPPGSASDLLSQSSCLLVLPLRSTLEVSTPRCCPLVGKPASTSHCPPHRVQGLPIPSFGWHFDGEITKRKNRRGCILGKDQ